MSRVSVAVSVVIAAVLTVITAALYREKPADAEHAETQAHALVPFDAQQADLIRITYPDGRIVTVRRAGESIDWWIFIDSPITSTRRVWPASPAAVRTALRLLDTVTTRTPADHRSGVDAIGATMHLQAADRSVDIDLASRTFAGRGLATIHDGPDTRTVDVPAEVHDVAMNPGPEIWREPLAFPGLAGAEQAGVSRITLNTPDRDLVLARVEGHWYVHPDADLTRPGLPADADAVGKLISTVASTKVSRFVDDPARAHDAGLENPTAVLTLESSRRLPDATLDPHIRRLRIGSGADLDASTLYAVLDDSEARAAAGDRTYEAQLVAIDGVGLSTIAMKSDAYLDPVALHVAPSDIGTVRLLDPDAGTLLEARRTIDGWRRVDAGEERVPSPVEKDMLDHVLETLTTTPGTPALADDVTAPPLCTIELLSTTNQPIGTYVFAQAPGPNETTRPVLMTERVAWTYESKAADPILRFLAE